ncbi:MAG: hypothetical protein U1E06_07305 [Tabrizicola sp.]|nr:hypothetical protein [Tabrizicola sp.]
MQKRPELDWVGYVLCDVITFLAENEMMQSAQMLAVAAAHIEHDMKRQEPVSQPTIAAEANVVRFPSRSRQLI